MTLSVLDPKPALVVIDLQKGITTYPTVHPVDDVVRRTAELAAAFRSHGLPVVLVNATGGAPGRTDGGFGGSGRARPADSADLLAELDPQPGDLRVTKQTWGAFHETSLHAMLQELGVTQVVVTGIATSFGVESTARSAHEHGYHVVLATDAMTDMDAESHRNSLERVFPRLGESTTTPEIIELLAKTR